jgi:hypothetical protein
LDLSRLTRPQKEALYARLCLDQKRRTVAGGEHPDVVWARSFAGNPRGFVRELVGAEWDGADWVAWRAFISAAFGQPFESDEELAIFRACTGLEDPPSGASRRVWAPVGRRGGKTRIFACLAVYQAVCFDWSKYLVPGEEGGIPILAESRDRAKQGLGYVKAALHHPRLQYFVERELGEEVYLKGNVVIRVSTASVAAARSRTALSALADEIAFWPQDESANPDKEILNALEPSMLTIPDAVLLAGSSTYARRGALWEAYEKHFGVALDGSRRPWDGRTLVWKASTEVMHPSVDREEIERARAEDPASAAAEYDSEFRVDVEDYVSREIVEACKVAGRYELPRVPGIVYQAFCDPSGGSVDSMTVAIAHRESGGMGVVVGVLDCIREVIAPFSPARAVTEIVSALREYGLKEVVGDYYGGEWPSDLFAAHGVRYEISELSKSEIYREFLPALNTKRAELLDIPRLLDQLKSLERRTARGGRDSIDHRPGAHDDVANAAAGVLQRVMAGKNQQMKISDGLLAKLRMPARV